MDFNATHPTRPLAVCFVQDTTCTTVCNSLCFLHIKPPFSLLYLDSCLIITISYGRIN